MQHVHIQRSTGYFEVPFLVIYYKVSYAQTFQRFPVGLCLFQASRHLSAEDTSHSLHFAVYLASPSLPGGDNPISLTNYLQQSFTRVHIISISYFLHIFPILLFPSFVSVITTPTVSSPKINFCNIVHPSFCSLIFNIQISMTQALSSHLL